MDSDAGRGVPACGGCGKRGVYEWPVPGTSNATLEFDIQCRYCQRSMTVTGVGTTPRDRAAALANVEPPTR